jgi:uncharacterized protein (TIGR03086 family)
MMTGTDRFFSALDLFDDVVVRVDADQWSAPSPCPGWTAAAVVGHVITGLAMIDTMLEQGAAVPPPNTDPQAAAGSDPAESWRARYQQTWANRQHLSPDAAITGPHGLLSVDAGLGQASLELLIHGWDLAQATKVPIVLPKDLAAPLLEELQPVADVIRASGMYGDGLQVPAEASAAERLLAFVGRRPTADVEQKT